MKNSVKMKKSETIAVSLGTFFVFVLLCIPMGFMFLFRSLYKLTSNENRTK